MLQWSSTSKKKSGALWSRIGLCFLTAVEVMDGYSAEWGLLLGYNRQCCWNSFVCFTKLIWQEQRITPNFHFILQNMPVLDLQF
jgi:hypothetical protein